MKETHPTFPPHSLLSREQLLQLPLFLRRTVCYLYQLTEPLHKLNPDISELQRVCVCFFSSPLYSHSISRERAATGSVIWL